MKAFGKTFGTLLSSVQSVDDLYLCVIIFDWVINSNTIKIYSWDQTL